MADQSTGRLRPEFLAGFDWGRVKRPQFADWARNKHRPAFRINERLWTPMKEGKPVPYRMIEALSAYLIDVLKIGSSEKYGVDKISEPGGEAQSYDREDDAWRLDYLRLFALKAKPFSIPNEAYCQGEEDIMEAALMVMHSFGYRETKSPSRAVCVAHAETAMKRTPEEVARLYFDAWRANETSVLFTVRENRDGSIDRLGISVVFAVTKSFYRRFRAGDAEDLDATAADLPGESLELFIEAVNENMEIDNRRDKARRSMMQVETALYQAAAASLPLNSWGANPSLITIGGDEESVRRLKCYHYKEVGTITRVTNKPVMEFAPPGKFRGTSPVELGHYFALKSTLLIYQLIRRNSLPFGG